MKMGPEVWKCCAPREPRCSTSSWNCWFRVERSGMIRKDLPPAFLAKSLHTMIDTLLTPQMAVESGMGLTELLNLTLKMIYGGILTDLGRRTTIVAEQT
jgi:hypothetical protein